VGLTNLGSELETCVGSCVHLVGVSISFEKNFYRLPFTPPSLVRRIGPSSDTVLFSKLIGRRVAISSVFSMRGSNPKPSILPTFLGVSRIYVTKIKAVDVHASNTSRVVYGINLLKSPIGSSSPKQCKVLDLYRQKAVVR
jgi:hypothetical protein